MNTLQGLTLREVGAAVLERSHVSSAEPARGLDTGSNVPDPWRAKPNQHKESWASAYVAALAGADLGIAATTLVIAPLAMGEHAVPLPWVVGAALAWPVAIAASGGYNRKSIGVGTSDIGAVFRGMLYLIVAGAVSFATVGPVGLVGLLVTATPIMCLFALLARFISRKIVHSRQRNGRYLRSVVVAGSLGGVTNLMSVLAREPHCGLRGIGACVPEDQVQAARDLGLNILGDTDHVAQAVVASGCDGVAVTAGQQPDFVRRLAWSLEGLDVDLFVHPGLVEVAGPRMHLRPHVGLPLLRIEHPHFSGWRRVVKRATDIVLTSVGLVFAAPFMLVVSLLIKMGDGGPVFFTQKRVGLDGRTFTMIKFRSMIVDAEARLNELHNQNEGAGGVLFKMKRDPRVTRVGAFLRKYSMDELPQLFNVLIGDMSLVGPRPPLPTEVDAYSTDVNRRLLVQPGLTGLWQVSGRSLLSWEESVRLDLRYVENWCLSLDLLLLWKTVWAVLAKRGAY